MVIFFVDLPIDGMVDLSIVFFVNVYRVSLSQGWRTGEQNRSTDLHPAIIHEYPHLYHAISWYIYINIYTTFIRFRKFAAVRAVPQESVS
jgi:hypothetical protein